MPERRLSLVNSLSEHFVNAGHSMVWAHPHRAAFFFEDGRKAGRFEEGLEKLWRGTDEYAAGKGSPKFTHYSSGNNVIVHFDDEGLGKSVWDEVAKIEGFATDPKNVFPLQTTPPKQTALAKMFKKVFASPEALVRFHEEAARANDASVNHLRKVGGGLERGELSKKAKKLDGLLTRAGTFKEVEGVWCIGSSVVAAIPVVFFSAVPVAGVVMGLPWLALGFRPYVERLVNEYDAKLLLKECSGLSSELALAELLKKHAPLEVREKVSTEKRMARRRIIGEAIRQLQDQQVFHETQAEELARKIGEEKAARKNAPHYGVPPWT